MQATNCVTLHPTEKDQFGMPIPNVHFGDHVNDIAMRNHAYKQGAMVYDAVGATRIIRVPPSLSAHNLGTCRQSASAARAGSWLEASNKSLAEARRGQSGPI